MGAAAMDKRVTLMVPPTGRSAMNEAVGDWTNFITAGDGKTAAAITDLSGREFVAAGGTQNTAQTKIEIRYRPGVVEKMRVLHSADVYTIESVLGQDKRMLLLMCSRGKLNG